MYIKKLKVNNFGKLENREIELNKKINVIYGENEKGKSTLLKFIQGTLYGLSKNKNGKEISDFDKYKPWGKEEFSGRIEYTLDNGESFEVFRDFKKKSPKIYQNMEEITSTFNVDKSKNIDYFFEQTGIDENTLMNTAFSEQKELKIDKQEESNIIQKLSNLVSTGDESISYKKVIDKINKKQLEEIGSDRTSGRPINIAKERLVELQEIRRNLLIYKQRLAEIDKRKKENEKILTEKEKYVEIVNEIKRNTENLKIKYAEISLASNIDLDYKNEKAELIKKYKDKSEEKVKPNIVLIILDVVAAIASVVTFAMLENLWVGGILSAITLLLAAINIIILQKQKKRIKESNNKIELENAKVKNEIEILEKAKDEKMREIENKQKQHDDELEILNEGIIGKYGYFISKETIYEILDLPYENLLKEKDYAEKGYSDFKIEMTKTELEEETITKELEKLVEIEEEIELKDKEIEYLNKRNNMYNAVKKSIEVAYNNVKESISPHFIESLSDTVKRVSEGKYKNVMLKDEDGIIVELENGENVKAERLSVGTIDQMYLALRLNSIKEISEENIPIILDESFVYFDDKRLRNILKTIIEEYDNQVIIFTCSKREQNILKELNQEYNLINL